MVDLEVHVEALGEVRRLHEGRDPALDGHVAAQEVGRARHQPGRVGGEAARRVLGGQDRDREVLLELHVVVQVVVGQRILVPVVPEALDGTAHPDRGRIVVGPRGVQHQREGVPHHAAHRLADLDVHARLGGRVDLVRGPARGLETRRLLRVGLLGLEHRRARVGGQAVAVAAEQPVDGQPRDLAGQIPQGHVHRPDRPPRGVATAREERLVEPLSLQRILIHHEGLERAHQGLGVVLRATARRPQEGVAFQSIVGAEAEQAQLALPPELAGVAPVGGARDVVPREQGQRDVGDLHETPSRPRAGLLTVARGYTVSACPFLLDWAGDPLTALRPAPPRVGAPARRRRAALP